MKEFKQVGLRDINVDESQHLSELDDSRCPCCGKGPLNGCTGVSKGDKDITPEDGSPTICTFCTSICIFRKSDDGKLTIEEPKQWEIDEWKSDPECWSLIMKIQKFIEQQATKKQLMGYKDYAKFKPRRY